MRDNWSFHLSPSPSSSSTRSSHSHLSVLTSVSSAASPLPSPSGSKTHAFFAAPFGDDSSMPQPPPNPPKRTGSVKSQTSEVSTDDTPRIEHKAPARSLNAEFFGPSTLPTPPASIRSGSAPGSRDNSTSPSSGRIPLPALSRLFPSRARYGTESEVPIPNSFTNVRRDFVHVDDQPPPHAHPAAYQHVGERMVSPVDIAREASSSSAQVTPRPPHHDEASSYVATQRPPSPPSSDSEPQAASEGVAPAPGVTLSSSSLTLELVKPLGTGTFSSVWLARDVNGQLGALELVRKSSLARSKSFRRGRLRAIDGTRPTRRRAARESQARDESASQVLSPGKDGEEVDAEKKFVEARTGRLVAVKMTERSLCTANSRSRVSFVREVEVLRVSAHPHRALYPGRSRRSLRGERAVLLIVLLREVAGVPL
ncbi:hypothetical protein C8Q77DRAFT_338207 [Trametes polyzona]|nr:hypothetical protein C8Q77DRAFT_338207 [Trametes polyzona]